MVFILELRAGTVCAYVYVYTHTQTADSVSLMDIDAKPLNKTPPDRISQFIK